MRSLLPGLLLLSCVLPAEDAVIKYAGQDLTISLPVAKVAPQGGRALPSDRVRVVDARSAIDVHDTIVVKLRPGADAGAVALRHQLVLSAGPLPLVWRMSVPGDVRAAIAASVTLRTDVDVEWVEQEVSTRAYPRIDITPAQWHLTNDGTIAGTVGNDLNVAGAWAAGATGAGVNITVVDSGIDITHPDLVANLKTAIDHDFVGNDSDPSAESTADASGEDIEAHATVVAGVAAARGDNGFGVTGVAYLSGIIPVRLITDLGISNSQKAGALGWLAGAADTDAANRTDVCNNSWGPEDDGIDHGAASDPSSVELAALSTGVSSGRGGKGVVYVFASGNGRQSPESDSADFDGYASNRFVMAIGASSAKGKVDFYSEGGVCLFANAPVGDGTADGIVSTDRQGANKGFNLSADYTASADRIIGTSFAAPQAAGVAALILQKNPNLTWRDVRHIIARTAVQIQPAASSWRTLPVPPGGSAALHWSPDFGFGRIDASAAVAAVTGWVPIPIESAPLQATASTDPSETLGSVAIPDGTDVGVGADLPISADGDFRVEEVEFAATVAHLDQSQLTYTLISPAGTKSVVVGRPKDHTAARTRVFTSLAHWGERANGTWRVTVSDRTSGITGTVGGVAISIYGYRESAAPGNAASGGSSGTAGLTTTNDPFLLPHAPGPVPGSSSDSGGGLCGLGSGSMALFASGLLAFLLRRNLRA